METIFLCFRVALKAYIRNGPIDGRNHIPDLIAAYLSHAEALVEASDKDDNLVTDGFTKVCLAAVSSFNN